MLQDRTTALYSQTLTTAKAFSGRLPRVKLVSWISAQALTNAMTITSFQLFALLIQLACSIALTTQTVCNSKFTTALRSSKYRI